MLNKKNKPKNAQKICMTCFAGSTKKGDAWAGDSRE